MDGGIAQYLVPVGGGAEGCSPVSCVCSLAVICILIYCLYSYFFGNKLAKQLSKAGWVLYYNPMCGYSRKQLQVLGGAYSKMVTCYPNGNSKLSNSLPIAPVTCSQITGYPTWVNHITGQQLKAGFKSATELSALANSSGC